MKDYNKKDIQQQKKAWVLYVKEPSRECQIFYLYLFIYQLDFTFAARKKKYISQYRDLEGCLESNQLLCILKYFKHTYVLFKQEINHCQTWNQKRKVYQMLLPTWDILLFF